MTLLDEFFVELNFALINEEDRITRAFWDNVRWFDFINPLFWIDYAFAIINKWQSAPLLAVINTFASRLFTGKKYGNSYKKSKQRVITGAKAFELARQSILDGSIKSMNYDANTVLGLFLGIVGRWVWRWYHKATTLQQIRWLIALIKMPNTEEALIAILKKRALSVKGLWTLVVSWIFVSYKLCIAAFALTSLWLLYNDFVDTGGTWAKAYLSQKNPFVKDRSLGWKRVRKA